MPPLPASHTGGILQFLVGQPILIAAALRTQVSHCTAQAAARPRDAIALTGVSRVPAEVADLRGTDSVRAVCALQATLWLLFYFRDVPQEGPWLWWLSTDDRKLCTETLQLFELVRS